MKNDVIVVGGGVIGLMSAYRLHKAGKSVMVLDQGEITNNTSFGNAGLLSAFEKHPLATPGIITKTISLMLQGKSPMLMNPTLDPKIYRWIWNFMKNANTNRVKRTLALFEKYGEMSMGLYQDMIRDEDFDFDFHRDGLLMVFTSDKSYQERINGLDDDNIYKIMNTDQTKEYMPFVNDKISGSLLLKRNGHIDPALMMSSLKNYLLKSGVKFEFNTKIVGVESSDNKITGVKSENGKVYHADDFILSTGSDISLAKKIGTCLDIVPAKGYSITFEMDESLKPKTSSLFNDLFIACTPRKNSVRLTSKLELGSTNPNVVQSRIDSIINNLKKYTIDFEIKNPVLWAGFRPLPPNDMPLIGRDERYSNLIHATGLGWLGITFGPTVGKIVSELIIKDIANKESDDVLLFSGFYQG